MYTEIFEADIGFLPDYIEKQYITTKFDLLDEVRKRSKKLLESISNSTHHTTSYYNQYKAQLDMFYEQLKKTVLPNRLETVMAELDRMQTQRADIEAFVKSFEALPDTLTDFKLENWHSPVEYATVYSADDIRFTFKHGQEIKA